MSCSFFSFTRRLLHAACAAALVLALTAAPVHSQQPAAQPTQPGPGQQQSAADVPLTAAPDAAHIAMLEKMLSGSTLMGQFTMNGKGDVRPSKERYELTSVKHLQGDMWMVTARIKYGPNDVTVPLPIPIRWAGDTPVITLDNFGVPGLGSYSCRVMFYEDRYMGYWYASSNKDHGGYLFGTIERAGDAKKDDAAAPGEKKEPGAPADGAAK